MGGVYSAIKVALLRVGTLGAVVQILLSGHQKILGKVKMNLVTSSFRPGSF
jgi:hypothetical protein